jgi:hypothetical protein
VHDCTMHARMSVSVHCDNSAGCAAACASAGVTPPYHHFEPSLNKLEYDWRWAAGATPFGPYGNFEGVSEIMQVSVAAALSASVSAAA